MNQLQMTLTTAPSSRLTAVEPPEPVRKISEARRAYLRRYYEANKEKAKEYQRRYNLTHKKKLRPSIGLDGSSRLRQTVRLTFNASDIMQAPTEKTIRILQLILRGERYFTF